MDNIKVVVWNMEWMNDLFTGDGEAVAFKGDNESAAHGHGASIRQRRNDLAGVIHEVDPEVLICVEGPTRPAELQLYFDTDINGTWETAVQSTRGSQRIGIAVRTDRGKFNSPAFRLLDTNNPPYNAAFEDFQVDVDGDDVQEIYKFERRPLYAELDPANGNNFRVLGLHLKSKGIFNALEWGRWWQRAEANRRKILAQATQIRSQFLDGYLEADETADIPLIVCGDINDGPGLDAAEKKFFGSGVERLMGSIWKPDLSLGNAIFDGLDDDEQAELDFSKVSTTSFRDPIFNYSYHHVWIDHMLYTRNMGNRKWVRDGEIHEIMDDGRRIWQKYPNASDHYPVSATIRVYD